MNGESANDAGRSWIVSFADLLSLLLSFMVMIFAMSNAERAPPQEPVETLAVETLAETVNWPERELPTAAARFSIERAKVGQALDLDYLAAVLETTLAADRLLGDTRIWRREDRLVLAIPTDVLFAPGEARLPEEVRPTLDALARVLGNVTNRISILGHADPEPVREGGDYPSNWELSLARALAVAESLERAGLGRPVACYGLADSRYDALREMSASRRRSMARRVDLVVYASAGG
jgi:chemotaxis protein MotB